MLSACAGVSSHSIFGLACSRGGVQIAHLRLPVNPGFRSHFDSSTLRRCDSEKTGVPCETHSEHELRMVAEPGSRMNRAPALQNKTFAI